MPRARHNDSGADEDVSCTTCGHLFKHHKKVPENDRACQSLTYDPMGPTSSGNPCTCPWFTRPKNKPVPTDKPIEMRLTWHGEHPAIGDFLMSMTRAVYAYKIIGIHVTRGGTLEITATKLLAKDLPKGAKTFALRWNARAPKNKRTQTGWSG